MSTVSDSFMSAEPSVTVLGEPMVVMPTDLYIPPNALQVFLEAFSGPLDLLLYLIKKQNLNILDIPISKITDQYMEYIRLIDGLRLELAAEYLVMAATLAELKSKLLLPRSPLLGDDESDPRAELIKRLQEYERFKQAAEQIDQLKQLERDVFVSQVTLPDNFKLERPVPHLVLQDVVFALQNLVERAKLYDHHFVRRELLSVRERMSNILGKLQERHFINFEDLFTLREGRLGVVVTFVAILELLHQSLLEIVQNEPCGVIHVKKR